MPEGGRLLLYTGSAIVAGEDSFLRAIRQELSRPGVRYSYRELDPDVFAEELLRPAYADVERIAAVLLRLVVAPSRAPSRRRLLNAAPCTSLFARGLRRTRDAAGGVLIGIGRALLGSNWRRDVTQVHADASPGRGTTAHRIDEHVVDGEQHGRFGVGELPAFEATQGRVAVGRIGNHDQRRFRATRLRARRGQALARWLRLAGSFGA